jgi:hypothetical protein
VVDVDGHTAAADVPDEVVWSEPHALAQQAQYLRGQASCQHGVIPNNLPDDVHEEEKISQIKASHSSA